MQTVLCRELVVAGFSAILIATSCGCSGRTSESGEPSALVASEQTPANEGATTKPVTAIEAARIIDLRTFPRMEGAEAEREQLAEVTYRAPGTAQQAVDFCVKKLTEAGWREPPGERKTYTSNGQTTECLLFTKQGHLLNVAVWPADAGISVYMANYGSFDTRTLPKLKDAVAKTAGSDSFPMYTSTSYTTDSKEADALEHIQREMAALGWQEYVPHLSSGRRSPGSLYFRKGATRVFVHAYKDRDQGSKTTVGYSAGLLSDDFPMMADAVSPRLEDGRVFQMRYDTAAPFPEVIDFYKKELPALGWKFREGAGLVKKESAFVYFDAANKDYLSIDLAPAAGEKTIVKLAHFPPESATRPSAAKPKPEKTSPAPTAEAVELADQAAEAAIKKFGGSIHRNKQLPGQPIFAVSLGLSDFKDADFKVLSDLKSLTSLTLYRTAVTDAGLRELANLKSLDTLDLGSTKVTDAGLKALAGLPSLERLTLNSTEITGTGLKAVALPKLRSLSLARTKLTDDGLRALAGLTSLRQLDLSDTKISGAGLKELSPLKSLEVLNLNSSSITDEGLKNVPKWGALQILSLYRTNVTDAGLAGLAGFDSLEHLDLSYTPVTGVGLKALTGRKALQRLELNSAKVTDDGLKGLAGFTALETLELNGAKVTDAGLPELFGLTSLQSLSLEKTKVSREGVEKLKKALPECRVKK